MLWKCLKRLLKSSLGRLSGSLTAGITFKDLCMLTRLKLKGGGGQKRDVGQLKNRKTIVGVTKTSQPLLNWNQGTRVNEASVLLLRGTQQPLLWMKLLGKLCNRPQWAVSWQQATVVWLHLYFTFPREYQPLIKSGSEENNLWFYPVYPSVISSQTKLVFIWALGEENKHGIPVQVSFF